MHEPKIPKAQVTGLMVQIPPDLYQLLCYGKNDLMIFRGIPLGKAHIQHLFCTVKIPFQGFSQKFKNIFYVIGTSSDLDAVHTLGRQKSRFQRFDVDSSIRKGCHPFNGNHTVHPSHFKDHLRIPNIFPI